MAEWNAVGLNDPVGSAIAPQRKSPAIILLTFSF
jgi:hypothetical protein